MNEPWINVSREVRGDQLGFRCAIGDIGNREDRVVREGIGGNEKSLVLVEDSNDEARLFELAVQKSGKYVRAQRAASGSEARQLLAGQRPSLVVLDCNLPAESGLDLLKEIRSMESYHRVPIVMMSGTDSDDDVRSAYAHGANSFIPKPLSSVEYLSCINVLLEYWLEKNCTSLPIWESQMALR
jgi:DNA-binding response OmpR family regulator